MTCENTAKPAQFSSLYGPVGVAYARRMGSPLDDAALMLRYRDGDVAAFEMLYRRHKDSLYRYLLRLSTNRDTAEDLFQEAWGKIIKARANYRPTARFSTYLFRVAHNCFIDHVRRNRRLADPGLLAHVPAEGLAHELAGAIQRLNQEALAARSSTLFNRASTAEWTEEEKDALRQAIQASRPGSTS